MDSVNAENATMKAETSHVAVTMLPSLIRLFFTLAVPVLLILFAARIIMFGEWFVRFEYSRPGFPKDVYGFTTEDRLNYAPFALEYLFNDSGIAYLEDLTFPDGSALFNDRELRHMEDVKVVTRYAFRFLYTGLVIALGLGLLAWRHSSYRASMVRGLIAGSSLTLSLIGAIVVVAVATWDTFFTTFHTMFFESGTWRFAYSDTLIRLFPEQFWFDAALVVGAFTVSGALGILLIVWIGRRSTQAG